MCEGDFIYNRLFAWKGSFGVIPPALDGHFVSGEFPIFETDASRLSPDYLLLLMSRPGVWAQIERESTGSTAMSRNRWKEPRFNAFEVVLPSLAVQRRVIDLIGAIDELSVRLAAAAGAAQTTLDALLQQQLDEWTDGRIPLGDLALMRSGPSWNAAEETQVPVDGATPVLKITNTRRDGRLVMDERAYVLGLPPTVLRLTQQSLVLIRTNGNRERIGNVYRATSDVLGHAVSAFQIALEPADPRDTSFLYWFLRAPLTQRAMTSAASGSTGLGNLAIGWLRTLAVPCPERALRDALVDTCEAIESVRLAATHEAEMLTQTRSALLESLLAGSHPIPDRYDELIEAL